MYDDQLEVGYTVEIVGGKYAPCVGEIVDVKPARRPDEDDRFLVAIDTTSGDEDAVWVSDGDLSRICPLCGGEIENGRCSDPGADNCANSF